MRFRVIQRLWEGLEFGDEGPATSTSTSTMVGKDGATHPVCSIPTTSSRYEEPRGLFYGKGLKPGIYSSPKPNTCAGYGGKLYRDDQMSGVYQKWAMLFSRATARLSSASQRREGSSLGKAGGGNLWRTTCDISDQWSTVTAIGFRKDMLAAYTGPGHWDDPYMLEVGNGRMTPGAHES